MDVYYLYSPPLYQLSYHETIPSERKLQFIKLCLNLQEMNHIYMHSTDAHPKRSRKGSLK